MTVQLTNNNPFVTVSNKGEKTMTKQYFLTAEHTLSSIAAMNEVAFGEFVAEQQAAAKAATGNRFDGTFAVISRIRDGLREAIKAARMGTYRKMLADWDNREAAIDRFIMAGEGIEAVLLPHAVRLSQGMTKEVVFNAFVMPRDETGFEAFMPEVEEVEPEYDSWSMYDEERELEDAYYAEQELIAHMRQAGMSIHHENVTDAMNGKDRKIVWEAVSGQEMKYEMLLMSKEDVQKRINSGIWSEAVQEAKLLCQNPKLMELLGRKLVGVMDGKNAVKLAVRIHTCWIKTASFHETMAQAVQRYEDRIHLNAGEYQRFVGTVSSATDSMNAANVQADEGYKNVQRMYQETGLDLCLMTDSGAIAFRDKINSLLDTPITYSAYVLGGELSKYEKEMIYKSYGFLPAVFDMEIIDTNAPRLEDEAPALVSAVDNNNALKPAKLLRISFKEELGDGVTEDMQIALERARYELTAMRRDNQMSAPMVEAAALIRDEKLKEASIGLESPADALAALSALA